jgi:photosystem II stability/assembly factor-like uncharacterized protein
MTRFKEGILSSAFYIFALLAVIASFSACTHPTPAKHPAEVVEIPGLAFSIRISAFPEQHGGFVAGAYYRFESLPKDGKNWVTAMDFRHDDPVPLPRQNVRFLTSDAAFVYMGWKYAVTTDGGKHWQIWNAEKDLPGWQCCNYSLIKKVELGENGNGKMIFSPIPGRPAEFPEMITSDFGYHWSRPQPHD